MFFFDGSNVNRNRELILCSLAVDKPPGRKIFETPCSKLYKKK